MAGQIVQILLNQPRRELLRPGWSKSRLASAMQPATFDSVNGKYVESQLPVELWREPNKRVIMLRPSTLRPDYWESTEWSTLKMGSTVWNFVGNQFLDNSSNTSMLLKRLSPATEVTGLAGVAAFLVNFLSKPPSEMKWVMQTKNPLTQNEGWSVWVHPPGIYTDRATDYMLIAFGDHYVLHIRMDGTASLWANDGTVINPSWNEKSVFAIGGGGVDHTKPFQITCVPWGLHYLSFIFSQQQLKSSGLMSSVSAPVENTYLYDINQHEDTQVTFDNISKQWVKTKQANLTVGLRRYLFMYGFAWARVRFAASATLAVYPERLPEVLDQADPTITGRAVFGQKSGLSATNMTSSFVNEDNTAWDKTTDQNLVAKYSFTATTDKLYTPELWSADIDIPEKTYTPGWTPVDISSKWNYLRFQLSVEPDVSTCEIKLEDTYNYADMFHGWGPLRILIETVNIFEGYIYNRQPVIETVLDGGISNPTPKAIVMSQISARDMWTRLNETPVSDWTFLDKVGIVTTMKKLIKRAGFTDADIVVSDPDGYLASLEFAGFVDPNDQKVFNQDASVGDALREIIKWFAIHPIRVRWKLGQWHIYMAPQYTYVHNTPPSFEFVLHVATQQTDAVRYAANKFKVLSNPEWTVEEPAFNELWCRASNSVGEDARGLQSVIPAYLIDTDSISDPTKFGFMGHIKEKIVSPPEITMAQTQTELDALTRVYWDRNAKRKVLFEAKCEWRQTIDADDFCWLTGLKTDGTRVSYGAYRIDHINVETTKDIASLSYDNRWSMPGDYSMVYVGKADDPSTPMFTTDAKLPS